MSLHKEFLKKYDLVRYPVVTEKSTLLGEMNKYVFIVRIDSNKNDLKKSFEELFDVKVKSVNTIIRKGKKRIFRGKPGQQSDTKRAIVTLHEGCQLDFSDIKV